MKFEGRHGGLDPSQAEYFEVTYDLIAVGDVMLDVLADAVPSAAMHAPVRMRYSGSAANAAIAAAGERASAAVVGRIGDDTAGVALRAAIEDAGATALLAIDPDRATGTVVYTGSGVVADRGATAALAPGDLPAALAAGAMLVSGYTLLHANTELAGRAALERAEAGWIAVDAAATGLLDESFHRRARGANAVFANEDEARTLTDLDPPEAALALALRYRLVVVKRGAEGAVAVLDGNLVEVPAPERLSGASPGAGDALAAGVLVALVRGATLVEALREGCRLGTAAAA
ncbi:MAG: carbohydrate kinase family protein [Gaiellaceae bacterium]